MYIYVGFAFKLIQKIKLKMIIESLLLKSKGSIKKNINKFEKRNTRTARLSV